MRCFCICKEISAWIGVLKQIHPHLLRGILSVSFWSILNGKFSILWLNERKEISRLFRQLSKIDKFNIGMSDHLEICVFWKAKIYFFSSETHKLFLIMFRMNYSETSSLYIYLMDFMASPLKPHICLQNILGIKLGVLLGRRG